jgi:hypothetical protein
MPAPEWSRQRMRHTKKAKHHWRCDIASQNFTEITLVNSSSRHVENPAGVKAESLSDNLPLLTARLLPAMCNTQSSCGLRVWQCGGFSIALGDTL